MARALHRIPQILAIILVVVVAISEEAPGCSVVLKDLFLPQGSYNARLQWGDMVLEEKIDVHTERPVTVTMNVPRINIRKPLEISIIRDSEVMIDVGLLPTPFGYEIRKLYIDPRVKMIDEEALIITEIVTITNVTVMWLADRQVRFLDIQVNEKRPPEVVVQNGRITVPNLVIDDKLRVEVIFEEGRVEASFLVAATGLQASSKFEGPFIEVKVNYTYGINVISWIVSFPITREVNSTILHQDIGYVEAGRSTPEVSQPSLTTIEKPSQKTEEERGFFNMIREYVGRFRTELMIVSGLLILAGMIRRKIALSIAGILMLAVLVLAGVIP